MHAADSSPWNRSHMIVLRFPTPTHFRVRALEWLLAGIMCTWAVILAQPEQSFGSAPFTALARIAPESVWVVICAAIGTSRLAALYVNGAWIPSPWVRLVTALASALFWLQVVLGMAGPAGIVSTGLAVYPWLLACDLYSMGRAAQDARLSREARALKPEAPLVIPPVQ